MKTDVPRKYLFVKKSVAEEKYYLKRDDVRSAVSLQVCSLSTFPIPHSFKIMSSELVCSLLLKAGVASECVSHMSVRVSAPQSSDCAVRLQTANETNEDEASLDRRTLIIVLLHAGRVHEATTLMGTGNYKHLAEMYQLTRAAFGPDPMRWSLATRASVLPQTAWAHIFRCKRDTFDELVGIVGPWLTPQALQPRFLFWHFPSLHFGGVAGGVQLTGAPIYPVPYRPAHSSLYCLAQCNFWKDCHAYHALFACIHLTPH